MLNVKNVLFAVRTVERSDGLLLVVKNAKVNKGQIYPKYCLLCILKHTFTKIGPFINKNVSKWSSLKAKTSKCLTQSK